VSFESETTALVVFWLPCAAPDMIGGVLWMLCVGFGLVRLQRCCLDLFPRDSMFDCRCNNSDDDARRAWGSLSSVRHDSGIHWPVRVLRPTPCIHEVNETVVFYLVRYLGIE
jgi:hypothetical protein